MKKMLLFGIALALILSFQACQTADKKSSTTKDSVSGDTPMVTGNHVVGAESTQTGVDEDGVIFLKKATVGGIMEIEAAKIAQTNAKSSLVKDFASKMLVDHTQANKELKILAVNKKVVTPDGLPEAERSHLDDMKRMNGGSFDKHYMEMMVTDHDKTVNLFKQGIANRDMDVKSFAKNTLIVIEGHDKMAKQILAGLK